MIEQSNDPAFSNNFNLLLCFVKIKKNIGFKGTKE